MHLVLKGAKHSSFEDDRAINIFVLGFSQNYQTPYKDLIEVGFGRPVQLSSLDHHYLSCLP